MVKQLHSVQFTKVVANRLFKRCIVVNDIFLLPQVLRSYEAREDYK